MSTANVFPEKGCYIVYMDVTVLLPKRLKEARLDKGYTQGKLGELTGIHEKALARYERGGGLPSLENLAKIASALKVTTDFFIFEHSKANGIPIIKDPSLYGKYFVLETLNEDDRNSILNLLDSLIVRQKFREAARGI